MGAFDHLEWTYDDGAFEQLFGLGRGEFEQKFCKKYKWPGVAWGGGGMLKLRFDWYISLREECFLYVTAMFDVQTVLGLK